MKDTHAFISLAPVSLSKMHILYVHKSYFDKRPPIISAVNWFLLLNYKVKLITAGINPETKKVLESRGVDIYDIGPMPNQRIKKALFYIKFRRFARSLISQFVDNYTLWIGSVDAAIAIGPDTLGVPYVLQIQELYDKNSFILSKLKRLMLHSRVNVVPDNARALIFRSWFDLKITPSLLPNKPLLINRKKYQVILNSKNAEKIAKLKGKKLFLYQALMIRMDTTDIARALLELNDEYVLGLFGGVRDKLLVEKLVNGYPNVVHFEQMDAPTHLTLTSHAYIGILTYNYESLNNVFCAPNKTWEYSAFGIPMIANNLPMLTQQLECFNAGKSYESGDKNTIKEAIRAITSDYGSYCVGSTKLFESVCVEKCISEILTKSITDYG